MEKIYLDYAATTPVDESVLESMLPYFNRAFGNSSSIHRFGQESEAAIEQARETVANWLGCQPNEVVFTSCGSESDNLALRGVALAGRQQRSANHILISPVEHHAVSRTALQLADLQGFEVEFLPVDKFGQVNPGDVADRLRPDTAIVSVIFANNEIGTINHISEIGRVCRERGIPFHTDAVQAAAYLPVDVEKLSVDLLSIGAHKFYGPKGVGALYIRKGTPIIPVQTGGGQEFGLRAGTSNTPYIVGLATAFNLANEERAARIANLLPLRDQLVERIVSSIPDTRFTGHPIERLPNHASFAFEWADGNQLLAMLDVAGFACSSGSACKTGDPEPSDVLLALGLTREWALGSLRVTLGSGTTQEHIENLSRALPALVESSRKLALVNGKVGFSN
jgi:cysteine desulfurase